MDAAYVKERGGKYYWFSASLSAVSLDGLGGGGWFSVSGNGYKFIGPYVDAYVLTDGK
jgi:hypothetical protein